MGAEGSRLYEEEDEYANYTPRARASSQTQQATSTTIDITKEFAAIRKCSVRHSSYCLATTLSAY